MGEIQWENTVVKKEREKRRLKAKTQTNKQTSKTTSTPATKLSKQLFVEICSDRNRKASTKMASIK